MKAPGDILLVACYELGHQPLAVAWPTAFLERLGFRPAVMDVSVEPFDREKVERAKLVAKVFGGGKVLDGLDTLNVGDQNGEFVLDFLREERIPVVARDLYDVWPRKVYFFPRTGKVLVKKLRSLSNDTVGRREHSYLERINQVAASGDFELFTKDRK